MPGVLALIGDSTNAVREGRSPSEAEVAKTIIELVKAAKGRVAVTTFASNVARVARRRRRREGRRTARSSWSAAPWSAWCRWRARPAISTACRISAGAELYGHFRRTRCWRSAPAARASRARRWRASPMTTIPQVTLNKGDSVIFSSRTIPGNEKAVGAIINGLVLQGVEVITDRDHLVHVSGHPRRDELRDMISWVRPQLLIPVHGEALHLYEHAKLARAAGVPKVLVCRNGDLVKLGPGDPGIIERTAVGPALQGRLDSRRIRNRARWSSAAAWRSPAAPSSPSR